MEENLYELGKKYEKEKDYEKAMKYYEKAYNEDKNIDAKVEIAKLYYFGRGVEKNYEKAFEIFNEIIEENDNFMAKWYLIKMYYNGEGTEKDYAKTIELIKKLHGYNEDIGVMSYYKAKMYEEGGYGIEKNIDESEKFYYYIELDLCLTVMYVTLALNQINIYGNSKDLINKLSVIYGFRNIIKNYPQNLFMDEIALFPTNHPVYFYGMRFKYLKYEEFDDIVNRLKKRIENNENIDFSKPYDEMEIEIAAHKILLGKEKFYQDKKMEDKWFYEKGMKEQKEKNYEKAIEYFEESAKLGNIYAKYNIGAMLIEKDKEKSKSYLKEVIELKNDIEFKNVAQRAGELLDEMNDI